MKTPEFLARKARLILDDMGASAATVARTVRLSGCVGTPGVIHDTPIGNYLTWRINATWKVPVHWQRDGVFIDGYEPGTERRLVGLRLPEAHLAYLDEFDAGAHPAVVRGQLECLRAPGTAPWGSVAASRSIGRMGWQVLCGDHGAWVCVAVWRGWAISNLSREAVRAGGVCQDEQDWLFYGGRGRWAILAHECPEEMEMLLHQTSEVRGFEPAWIVRLLLNLAARDYLTARSPDLLLPKNAVLGAADVEGGMVKVWTPGNTWLVSKTSFHLPEVVRARPATLDMLEVVCCDDSVS